MNSLLSPVISQPVFEEWSRPFKDNRVTLISALAFAGAGIFLLRKWLAGGVCHCANRLDGKTAIVTGGNSGIGKETAKELAKRGAKVILACRDILKAERVADEIRAECNNAIVIVYQLDLASLDSVRSFAKEVLAKQSQLHLLINNAGISYCPQWKTEDGFEMQLGVNHLGHFLLTMLLLDLLKQSAPSRIINVSSLIHRWGEINFEDINLEKCYSPGKAYSQSKLANILFTKELARILEGTAVFVVSLHPGIVKTEIGRHVSLTIPRWRFWLSRPILLIMKTPKQGAQTSIYCAVDDEIADLSGNYFSDCAKTTPSKLARDNIAAKRLWDLSLKMVGLA